MKAVILLLFLVFVSVATSAKAETEMEMVRDVMLPFVHPSHFEKFCTSFVTDERDACEDLKQLVAILPACTNELRNKIAETFGGAAPQVAEIVCYQDEPSENLFTRNAVFESLTEGYLLYVFKNVNKN